MESDKPRILVIGAGVNGSVCAARLHAGGADVTVLARSQRLAVLERDGIVIENPFNQRRTVAKVPLIGELAPADRYDYILVVVRRNQVSTLLPTLAANCSPNVVFMYNNLLVLRRSSRPWAASASCWDSSSPAASAKVRSSTPSAPPSVPRWARPSVSWTVPLHRA